MCAVPASTGLLVFPWRKSYNIWWHSFLSSGFKGSTVLTADEELCKSKIPSTWTLPLQSNINYLPLDWQMSWNLVWAKKSRFVTLRSSASIFWWQLCHRALHFSCKATDSILVYIVQFTSYIALFEMQATRWANRHVEMVSIMFLSSTDTVAIIAVRQFPPRLSRSSIVRREFR